MSIPMAKWHRLGKKTFWLFFLRHSKLLVILMVLLFLFTRKVLWGNWQESYNNFFNTHPNLYLTPGFSLGFLWLCILGYILVLWVYSFVIYRQYKFMLDENAFYVRRGIFFIRETVIPYRQIQNVEINRPYLYRIFGLAELDLTTLTNTDMNQIHDGKSHKKKNLLPVIDYRIAKILAKNLVERGTYNPNPIVTEESDGIKVDNH